MNYGYIRVSTDKQTVENQRFEINRFCEKQEIIIALTRKKAEGVILGLLKGRKSSKVKLSGKELEIQKLMDKKVSKGAISRILGVHRLTVSKFI